MIRHVNRYALQYDHRYDNVRPTLEAAGLRWVQRIEPGALQLHEEIHLWVRVVSAGGEPLGEASSLDREEGELNASAAQRDGWLIVGARQTLPSPLRACIWRLDRRGDVLWTADATPPANGPE